jgi:hypothetical protein
MRMKRLLVALLAFVMVAAGVIGDVNTVQAETRDAIYIADEELNLVVKPGEKNHISIPIKTKDNYVTLPTFLVSAEDSKAPFTFSEPTISMGGSKLSGFAFGSTVDLEFDVKVKETASIGEYPIDIKIVWSNFGEGSYDCTLKTSLFVEKEKDPVQLTVTNVVLGNSNVGSGTNLSFTVKNEGEITAKNVYMRMDYAGIMDAGYTAKDIKVGDLTTGQTKDISLPITILSSAGTGRKTIKANFTYKTQDGDSFTAAYDINVNLSSNISAPKLIVQEVNFDDGLKPGDDFNLSVNLKNAGAGTASDIVVSVDDTSVNKEGVLRNYYSDGVAVSSMKKDTENTVKVPMTVSKYATGGLKEVKINVTYKDSTGVANTISNTVYVDVVGEATAGSPNIIISGVSQSPQQPVAGERLDVSFYVENKSSVDVAELKIAMDGLTGTTFIPMESEPYQYIEKLKAGEKVKVTLPLMVSDSIPEGLNNLSVKCTYTGGEAAIVIPIRDVQNDLGSSSKPKLIVSKYVTDVEELRAGNTFNFTFDVYNTNSSVAAKNITITVTQADNIFSVTQGSNSFFINKIDPGETVSNTLEMKVKSDASTKTYPIELLIEYEYDGAEPNPTTGEVGESRKETLNLQAVENSRPVVDYVNVYSWDGMLTVGGQLTLSFQFYNMGRSPLNNVIARLEGDGFTKTDGDMYFIGNVEAGGSSYIEFPVVANMEGTASGVLKITFEDSNGDEVSYTKDFSQEIMGAPVIDPGIIDGGGAGEVFNPQGPIAKKAILPVWAFIIIQVVIFILFIPITRKIIISVYKAKLLKKEQEQY